jgi:hypothetical protein
LPFDVVARAADRGQHRRIGRRAVFEQHHRIAGGQRIAGERLLDREVAIQQRGVLAAGLQAIEDRLVIARRQQATVGALDLHRSARTRHVGHDDRQRAEGSEHCCQFEPEAAGAQAPQDPLHFVSCAQREAAFSSGTRLA